MKQVVANLPVLQYYSLSQEVTIQCAASKTGLGAVLLQEGRPVAYASRSLSAVETRFAHIEKECIIFACKKLDHYIYGCREVTVHSDHQPLESIFKKHLAAAPARFQCILLHLQRYTLNVRYLRGSQNVCLADTLSRASLVNTETDHSSFVNVLELVPGNEHSNWSR